MIVDQRNLYLHQTHRFCFVLFRFFKFVSQFLTILMQNQEEMVSL